MSPEAKLQVHVKDSKNHRGYFSSVDYSEFNQDPKVSRSAALYSNQAGSALCLGCKGSFAPIMPKDLTNVALQGVHIKDNKEGFFFGSDNLIGTGNTVPKGQDAVLPEVCCSPLMALTL